jgi:LmbE family N-acetylglucosaminyl deacetylase
MNRLNVVLPVQNKSRMSPNNHIETELNKAQKIVVFSPHLDDAILSMGVLLYYASKKKKEVTVVSIFTEGSDLISPLTTKLLQNGTYPDAGHYFQVRRDEDMKGLKVLGVKRIEHLGYVDAGWRTAESGEALYTTTLGVKRQEDSHLVEELSLTLKQFQTDGALMFAPLGRGRHIDHIITREACMGAFSTLRYYVDFPYSDRFPDEEEFITAHNLTTEQWQGEGYKEKAEAIMEYTSQMPALFPDGTIRLPWETYLS